MNAHFARDIVDYRHTELIARAAQSRRYHVARQASTGSTSRPVGRIGSVRRPFSALHAWLVAGAL
jgi:hypothetical protein